MKKFLFFSIIFTLVFVFTSLPFLATGQILPDAGDGVGESTPPPPSEPQSEQSQQGGGGLVPDCPPEGCGWTELLILAQNVMNFLIIISLPLSAIAFAYAGFLYLTAAGSEDKIKKAHEIFKNVAIGLFFVLAAWLIVWLIISTLLREDSLLQLLRPNK